mmetsp:Transcript_116568/g.310105  ORF Transcript_116568/g.310105 Transcript_116568/m.310105 type:complete len:216 (-) Transcript_116568:962-1609(-)
MPTLRGPWSCSRSRLTAVVLSSAAFNRLQAPSSCSRKVPSSLCTSGWTPEDVPEPSDLERASIRPWMSSRAATRSCCCLARLASSPETCPLRLATCCCISRLASWSPASWPPPAAPLLLFAAAATLRSAAFSAAARRSSRLRSFSATSGESAAAAPACVGPTLSFSSFSCNSSTAFSSAGAFSFREARPPSASFTWPSKRRTCCFSSSTCLLSRS